MGKRKYIVGNIYTNKLGYEFQIMEYNNPHDLKIKFKNGIIKHTDISHITTVTDTIVTQRNMGCYHSQPIHNYLAYKYWSWLCNRAIYKNNKLAYQDVQVCQEWYDFSNFEKWFEENYYEIPNCRMELDKDILIKKNKVYQPNACCFVPQEINSLLVSKNLETVKHHFAKNTSPTNQKLPVGVTWCNDKKKYRASINYHGNVKNLGRFNTIEEAFNVYKIAKEQYIKDTANKYKQYIPNKLYEALINYKVEIDD